MSAAASIAEPTHDADPAEGNDALVDQAIRLLLQAGNILVQDLLEDAITPPIAKIEPYERLARSLRRTIALSRHVAENPTKRAPTPAERRTQSRRQVIREVESAIETRPDRSEPPESLRSELDERLDDPEFDRELATRPIYDIIRDLKRDLGLDGNITERHPRRTPADVDALNARAAAQPRPKQRPTQRQAAQPDPGFPYQPGKTRGNGLLNHYRDAPDG